MNSRIAVNYHNICIEFLPQKTELHVIMDYYGWLECQLNNFCVALLYIVHEVFSFN